MNTLDTLSVRFEADAGAVFAVLDGLSARLESLRGAGSAHFTLTHEIETLLTATADGAISHALSDAGERLSSAVRDHEVSLDRALSAAQNVLAAALQSAVNKLAASINVTDPLNVDGYRLATAALRGLRLQEVASGSVSAR